MSAVVLQTSEVPRLFEPRFSSAPVLGYVVDSDGGTPFGPEESIWPFYQSTASPWVVAPVGAVYSSGLTRGVDSGCFAAYYDSNQTLSNTINSIDLHSNGPWNGWNLMSEHTQISGVRGDQMLHSVVSGCS
jgi:hypothetical protein